MNANDIKEHSAACFRGADPFCADSCPLRVDVRGLADKLSKGDFNAAYRLYRGKAIFPGIVSRLCHEPCKAGCARAGLNPPIGLAALERATVAHATSKAPVKFNLPPRPQSVVVIGAGLSGLACALRLASKKYHVTVYDRREKPGGSLWELLPEADFLPEIEAQFAPEKLEWRLGQEVASLDAITADALYIATGAGGASFGLPLAGQSGPFFDGGKFFVGGAILGALPVEALAHGARAAQAMEAFLKSGQPQWEDYPPTAMRVLPLTPGAAKQGGAVPEPQGGYAKDEAIAEAARCLRCDCGLCHDSCDLMQYYKKYPKKISDEVYATLNPVDFYGNRVNTRFISSCNLCGLCGESCPVGIDTGELMQKSRTAMQADGVLPPAFHSYWLADMAHAGGEDAALLLSPKGVQKLDYVFFPGCQLGASMPETARAAYARLRELHPATAIFLECCGAPLLWAGEAGGFDAHLAGLKRRLEGLGSPKLVAACPSCLRLLRENLPGLDSTSIYELLPAPVALPQSAEACIFDPCSSRGFPQMQARARELAASAGVAVAELPYAPGAARCCGWGGHIYPAGREYMKELVQKRVELSPLPYLTYCSNCRDTFAAAGKPVRHLLDLLLGLDSRYEDAPPSLSQRRENRRILKQSILRDMGEPAMRDKEKAQPVLFFSPELIAQMNKDLLLEDDLRRTVEHCENTGLKVLDPADGSFTGHLLLGVITCWVRYKPEAEGFKILQAYSHRMQIVEEA